MDKNECTFKIVPQNKLLQKMLGPWKLFDPASLILGAENGMPYHITDKGMDIVDVEKTAIINCYFITAKSLMNHSHLCNYCYECVYFLYAIVTFNKSLINYYTWFYFWSTLFPQLWHECCIPMM